MKVNLNKMFIEDIEWEDDDGKIIAKTDSNAIFDYLRTYALAYGIRKKDEFDIFEYMQDLYEENDFIALFKENTTGDVSALDKFKKNRDLEVFIEWIDNEGRKINSLGFLEQSGETKQN